MVDTKKSTLKSRFDKVIVRNLTPEQYRELEKETESRATGVDSHGYPIVLQVKPERMANRNYSLIVRPWLDGIYGIQLCDATRVEDFCPAPHGEIVRELITSDEETMQSAVTLLMIAMRPLVLCQEMETPDNCKYPGKGRIRLDK